MFVKIKDYFYNLAFFMRYFFYSLLIILFIVTIIKRDTKTRKDQLCKEGLFFQMIFNQCTPRDFLLKEGEQENI